MPRFSIDNPSKMFMNNCSYRSAYHEVEPEYRTSAPANLLESNQSPEIVNNVVNTGPSGW